jgi:hypothetical protein
MKYFKYKEEDSLIGEGTRFVETNDGIALREVTINGDAFLGSNICYPHWGMRLADAEADYKDVEGVTPISQVEFDMAWNAHLSHNAGRRVIIKQAYPIGTRVQGHMVIFYPQGVIVDLGDSGTLGLANYNECRASTKPEFMYPRHCVSTIVSGYDELNQWLLLKTPQVHEEKVSAPYWWG